jgi:hypothetical protein
MVLLPTVVKEFTTIVVATVGCNTIYYALSKASSSTIFLFPTKETSDGKKKRA